VHSCRAASRRAWAVNDAGVTVDAVSSLEGFERLEPRAWDALVRTMRRPSPFLLHAWLACWWRSYGADAELAVHVARRNGRLVAALPLFVRRRLGLSVGSFLGGRHSALADALVAPGEASGLAAELARSAARSDIDYVDLFGLPTGSRLEQALGSDLRLIERVESPVLDLGGGWEAVYQAKTSSKSRSLHRRRRRQLVELGQLEVEVAREPSTLGPALEEAFRIHALRWAGRPDGSDFGTPVGQSFHRAATLALARLEVPRIVLLKLDGRAIAFHYYFALEGAMYVHRLGFDPAFARYSPGLVNTLDTIENAAAEGLTRVEFLGGAERYKQELADRFEPLCQGIGLARHPLARAVVEARLAHIRLRLRLKRNERLHRLYLDGVAPARTALASLRALPGRARVSGRAAPRLGAR
jgi:CelD/BcsL family acetyltransferase involved in cellulose biosynthesis